MNNIVLIGAPGSGKGTQGEKLKLELNLLRVSPGDILRAKRSDTSSELGRRINEMLDSGKLLSSEIINKITFEYIKENISSYSGLLFDGYPRMIEQATYLDENIKLYNSQVNKALFLEVSLDSLMDRLTHRYMCKKCGAIYNHKTHNTRVDGVCDSCGSSEFSTRKDDSEIDIIKTRFNEFNEKTQPVIDYYQNQEKLITINASGDINTIYQNILNAIA